MTSPRAFLLLLALALSSYCNSFVILGEAPIAARVRHISTSAAVHVTPLSSHAIGPDESVSADGEISVSQAPENDINSNDNVALLGSMAGLTLLAVLLGVSSGIGSPTMGQMDDGSAATLLVDAFFGAIAVIVSMVSGDDV